MQYEILLKSATIILLKFYLYSATHTNQQEQQENPGRVAAGVFLLFLLIT